MHKLLSIGALLAVFVVSAQAAPPKKAKPHAAKKPAQNATKGAAQMAGGDGQFGQTYTVRSSTDSFGPINFTLVRAEYSVERVNMTATDNYAPKVGEKLLVIHYRIKNPNKDDFYYSSRSLFQTVGADNTTGEDSSTSRRESQKDLVAYSIKPSQGIDDLVTYAVVPANGAVPKLILKLGRTGSSDQVLRYMLGTGANTVQPIPAPYADPTDPSGATARAEIPAQIGTTYVAGHFDLCLDSVAFAPGPFGDKTADDGKKFLVATVTMTNKTWGGFFLKGDSNFFPLTLITSDDEKAKDFDTLKGKRDEAFDGETIDAGDSRTLRLLFQVPKDVTAKTLKIAEGIDNSDSVSHAFVYDLSSVK